MFAALFRSLHRNNLNDDVITRRRYPRRSADRCIAVIAGRSYPVENWSMGGFLCHADGRMFSLDSGFEVTLRFRLRNSMLDVPLRANVVRKSRDKIAFEFEPLTQQVKNSFQSVVDDVVSRQFADSQIN